MKRSKKISVSIEFPNRLKQLRQEYGWSQEYVAKKIGADMQRISKYERGLILPTADVLIQLAEIFEVSLDYLLRDNIAKETKLNLEGIKNKKILDRIQQINKLSEEDQNTLVSILDGLLAKRQLQQFKKKD